MTFRHSFTSSARWISSLFSISVMKPPLTLSCYLKGVKMSNPGSNLRLGATINPLYPFAPVSHRREEWARERPAPQREFREGTRLARRKQWGPHGGPLSPAQAMGPGG